jgi:hypothetical protein
MPTLQTVATLCADDLSLVLLAGTQTPSVEAPMRKAHPNGDTFTTGRAHALCAASIGAVHLERGITARVVNGGVAVLNTGIHRGWRQVPRSL